MQIDVVSVSALVTIQEIYRRLFKRRNSDGPSSLRTTRIKEKFVKTQKVNRGAKMAAAVKTVEASCRVWDASGLFLSSLIRKRVIIYIYIKLHHVSLHLFSEMPPFRSKICRRLAPFHCR